MGETTDIVGDDHLRTSGADIGELLCPQTLSDLGLQQAVTARRTAAKLRIRNRSEFESRRKEQGFAAPVDALPMLKRAGRVECDNRRVWSRNTLRWWRRELDEIPRF